MLFVTIAFGSELQRHVVKKHMSGGTMLCHMLLKIGTRGLRSGKRNPKLVLRLWRMLKDGHLWTVVPKLNLCANDMLVLAILKNKLVSYYQKMNKMSRYLNLKEVLNSQLGQDCSSSSFLLRSFS
jgi:hypothetical protein